jgi:hypothetical protein
MADAEALGCPTLVRMLETQQQEASEWFSQLPVTVTAAASLEAFHWALAVKFFPPCPGIRPIC